MNKALARLAKHCKGKPRAPYVYEAKDEALTQAVLDHLVRENLGICTSTYRTKTAKYIGQRCTDCSGLISWYTGVPCDSYNYHDIAVERIGVGHLDEPIVGWAFWKPGHVGVYIGDGWCIEARDISYGIIESRVTVIPWQKVLKFRDIDYTPAPVTHTQGFRPAADGQR